METVTSVTKDPTMFEDPSIKETIFEIDISIIPKHTKISKVNMSTQVHHDDISSEIQKNTPYSHYVFIYNIIFIKKL